MTNSTDITSPPNDKDPKEGLAQKVMGWQAITVVLIAVAFVLFIGGRIFLMGARLLISPLGILSLLVLVLLLVGIGWGMKSSSGDEQHQDLQPNKPHQPEGKEELEKLEQKSDRMLWRADPEFAVEIGAQPPEQEQGNFSDPSRQNAEQ